MGSLRAGDRVNPAPICDNCKRAVFETERVAVLRGGAIEAERDLCSACRVHVVDCFAQAAPWIGTAPGTAW